MDIERARERVIVAKLILGISRTFAHHYYRPTGHAPSAELQLVASALFVAHVEGRPLTASGLARLLEIPRVTALRRLNELIQRGYVIRKGHIYCMVPEAMNDPPALEATRENIRRIEEAARLLSNLDTNISASDT